MAPNPLVAQLWGLLPPNSPALGLDDWRTEASPKLTKQVCLDNNCYALTKESRKMMRLMCLDPYAIYS